MNKINIHNEYATTPVPQEASKSWISIALIVIGVGITIPAYFLGSLIVCSLDLTGAAIAIYSGGIIYTFFAVLMVII